MGTDAIHTEAGNDVHAGIGSTPDQSAEGMFLGSVEGSRDEHECRGNCAFKSALKRAKYHQAGPVLCERNAEHNNAPAAYDDAQKLADVELLHQVVARELADHVGYVEDCRQPAELLADESSIFSETEDGHGAD